MGGETQERMGMERLGKDSLWGHTLAPRSYLHSEHQAWQTHTHNTHTHTHTDISHGRMSYLHALTYLTIEQLWYAIGNFMFLETLLSEFNYTGHYPNSWSVWHVRHTCLGTGSFVSQIAAFSIQIDWLDYSKQ